MRKGWRRYGSDRRRRRLRKAELRPNARVCAGGNGERPVVFHVEKMVFADVKGAPELLEPLCEKRAVLCCEVGSGVIPIDYETRLGREAVGRLCVRLAQRAECVVRMVCGIPTVIKGDLPCRSI